MLFPGVFLADMFPAGAVHTVIPDLIVSAIWGQHQSLWQYPLTGPVFLYQRIYTLLEPEDWQLPYCIFQDCLQYEWLLRTGEHTWLFPGEDFDIDPRNCPDS